VWRSGKLVSGQRNGRSPRSSHFQRKVILNSAQITVKLLLSHASKILLQIVLEKIRVKTETEIADEHCSPRSRRRKPPPPPAAKLQAAVSR